MKTKAFTYLILFLTAFSVYAQNEQKQMSNFSLGLNFSLGNSLLNTEEFRNLEGSISVAQFDVGYDLINESDKSIFSRFSTGLEVANYKANLFTDNGQASLSAEYIRVPLILNGVYRLGKDKDGILSNTKFIGGIGGYMNYVYHYGLSNVESSTDLDDVDVDFGFLFNLGLEQDVSKRFSIALGLNDSLMGDENEKDQLNFNNTTFYFGTRYRL